ncbi:MAG TPA: secretin N-terminal domain-containing protein, partial [Opitutus sp.]|nr:secretin N-terminal domain-containing protein [Opitutus sp.]
MRTRPFLPALILLALFCARARGQAAAPATAPANPAATAPANGTDTTAAEPAAPAAPEVTIKAVEPAHPTATKSRGAGGQDTLSVDFPETDIRDILRNVADLFELNLVIPETLQGKASIKLRDVTWRQIFESVLSPVGYTYIEDGNIIKIVSNESLQNEPVSTEVFVINYAKAGDLVPTLNALIDPAHGGKIVVDSRTNSLVITETSSHMNHIRPIIEKLDHATGQVMIESKFVEVTSSDVKNLGVNWASLQGYRASVGPGPNGFGTYDRSQDGTISNGTSAKSGTASGAASGTTTSNTGTQTSGSNSSNTVTSNNGVITATASNGTTASIGTNASSGTTGSTTSSTTEALDLLNNLTGNLTNTRTLSAVFTADQFGIVLSALQTLNSTKIVSNPTIVTLNNSEATINVGESDPIPRYQFNQQTGTYEVSGFEYKDIGINLKVTPQVNARGFIKLTLTPEVSQKNGVATFGPAEIPIIGTRKATTQVSLKDGYTMGIGGLLTSNANNGSSKVPVLGSIPLLGKLFSSKSKNITSTNLLIFITAKSISPEGATIDEVFDPQRVRDMDLKKEDLPGY